MCINIFRLDVLSYLANHNCQFTLEIDVLALPRQNNRIAGANNRGRGLQENQGLVRNLFANLCRVSRIVFADANDLRWNGRGKKLNFFHRNAVAGVFDTVD